MGMDIHWWHCSEASHLPLAGPGTCTEIVSVWVFPKLCPPAVQIISFSLWTWSQREPHTHFYCCHRVGPGHQSIHPLLAPPPAAFHPWAGHWASLGLSPAGLGWASCPHLAWPLAEYGAACAFVYMGVAEAAECVCVDACRGLGTPGGACLCVWYICWSVWQGDTCAYVYMAALACLHMCLCDYAWSAHVWRV